MQRRLKVLTCAPAILLALLVGVLYYVHPMCLDDLWHREGWTGNFVHDVTSTIATHFEIDNGRLGNDLGIVFLTFPKWLTASIMALAFLLMFCLCSNIAGITKKTFYNAVLVLAVMLLLPWTHFMFVTMFTANYMVSSVVFLWVFALYCNDRIGSWWVAAVLGVLVGAWHEQFGAAMLAVVCGVAAICRRGRASRVDVSMAAGLILGLVYLYMAPGTGVRMDDTELFDGMRYPLKGAVHGAPYYILIIATIITSIKHSDIWQEKVFTAGFSAATGAFCIWRIVSLSMQVTWLMNLMSIVVLVWLANRYISIPKRVGYICAGAIWVAVYAHICTCLPWFVKMNREYNEAMVLLSEHPEGPVFYTFTRSTDAPAYILGKPNFNAMTAWASPFERVVPAHIRDVQHPGIYGTDIILPFDSCRVEERGDIAVSTTEKTFYSGYHLVPVEGSDGAKYLYVWLNNLPMRACGDIVSYEFYRDIDAVQ